MFLIPASVFAWMYLKHLAAQKRFKPRVVPRKANNIVFPYGVCDVVSTREYMEDRHLVVGNVGGIPDATLYAVFDGHAGSKAAE